MIDKNQNETSSAYSFLAIEQEKGQPPRNANKRYADKRKERLIQDKALLIKLQEQNQAMLIKLKEQ